MSGRWLCRLMCLVSGHEHRLWKCGPNGLGWECPRCFDVKASAVLRGRRKEA